MKYKATYKIPAKIYSYDLANRIKISMINEFYSQIIDGKTRISSTIEFEIKEIKTSDYLNEVVPDYMNNILEYEIILTGALL